MIQAEIEKKGALRSPGVWRCSKLQLSELGADLLSGRTHLCPQCRRDLTDIVRTHLYGCAVLPVDVRQKAQALRKAARLLVKESRRLHEQSGERRRASAAWRGSGAGIALGWRSW